MSGVVISVVCATAGPGLMGPLPGEPRIDLGRRGVTANCVCPGATLTGMTEGIPEGDRAKFARRHIPLGRYGRPEEIAHMIVALTAEGASFVNGAVIAVDGGMTAGGR